MIVAIYARFSSVADLEKTSSSKVSHIEISMFNYCN